MTPITDAVVELLWAQWSELGVPGVRDPNPAPVVSPVDLVLYTPALLADRDARLAMLVQAWCAQHGGATFSARELNTRRRLLGPETRSAFDAWAGVLHHAVGEPWPASSGGGPPIDPRTVPARSDRPACLHLRARALFGVGVRADLVVALLEAHATRRPLSSPDLAPLGYSARAVQVALAAFEAAGMILGHKAGRTHTWTLTRPGHLSALLDADGLRWLPWHHALPLLLHLVRLEAQPPGPLRVVRAHETTAHLAPHVHALHGLPPLPVRPGDLDAADRLLGWGAEVVALLRAT